MNDRFTEKLGRFYDNGRILNSKEVLDLLNQVENVYYELMGSFYENCRSLTNIEVVDLLNKFIE